MGTVGPIEWGGSARIFPLAPIHFIGLACFQVAFGLAFVDPLWSLMPLFCLLLVLGVAPFFPRWRLFSPVISKGNVERGVLLSFDDGPDPESTPALLRLLEEHQAKALFFVVGKKAQAYPALIRAMVDAGHALGNHSWDHDPWLMFRSPQSLAVSIDKTQEVLEAQGFAPRLFRPPAWVVGPRLWPVLLRRGMVCMVASCRALDWGNRRLNGLAERLLRKVRPGQILALHDCVPPRASLQSWLSEVEALLNGLAGRKITTASPDAFLGFSASWASDSKRDPIVGFYDGMAQGYDRELESSGQGRLRQAEEARVLDAVEGLGLAPAARVLDWGAGTGRFALSLLRQGHKVLAIDLSPAMLAQLERKAKAADLEGLTVQVGGVEDLGVDPGFDLVLACSVLEYVTDLESALTRAASLLRPGGHLILTSAHPSCWRFFVQIGNAMRQGLWLSARPKRHWSRVLKSAGLKTQRLEDFGLPDILGQGMVLLAVARRPN
ncbi:MAG: polysaccharide deacetylase family protein [Deltaproteobacteria bacterium]|nr:polysaccharide deacetylase family protein [Deltaproteobacteria bacterium]